MITYRLLTCYGGKEKGGSIARALEAATFSLSLVPHLPSTQESEGPSIESGGLFSI